ncbi:unnamed protein product [Scytosiphon promiscuus]
MRRKRNAGHSGLQSGTGAGISRSERRLAKKRVRARMSSAVGLGLPDVSGRLTDDEYRQQQRQAREDGKRRREHELAEHDRERVERSRASNRRHSDGQIPAGVSGRRRSSGGRRESAPGRRGSMSRRRECGRDTCGWRPSGPGTVCTLCSGVVVHDEDDRLCPACHRTLNNVGDTHLGKVRLASAQQLVTEARAEGSPMPAFVLDTFQPTSDCLCMRTDCFATFLKSKERNAVKFCGRRCVECSRAGPGIQWYRGGETAGASCVGGVGGPAEGSTESSFVWSGGEDACASVEREGLGVEPEGLLGRRREAHRRKLCPLAVRTLLHRARRQNRDTQMRLRSGEGHQTSLQELRLQGEVLLAHVRLQGFLRDGTCALERGVPGRRLRPGRTTVHATETRIFQRTTARVTTSR